MTLSDTLMGYAAWSPSGDRILTDALFEEERAMLWDAHTGELLASLDDHANFVLGVGWSDDGSMFYTKSGDVLGSGGTENAVHIWDADTLEKIQYLGQHNDFVNSADFSPDGTRILTANKDGTVSIWDVATGDRLLEFSIPPAYFLSVDWSPDGTQIVTRSGGSEIRIYDLWQTTEELIDYAHACCVFRELTPEERQQFGLPPAEEPPPIQGSSRQSSTPLVASFVAFGLVSVGLAFVGRRLRC